MITVPISTSSPYNAERSDSGKVAELFASMRHEQAREEAATAPVIPRSLSSAGNLTALPADISPSSSHFFEVLYIGKIKVSHKKVPDSFIDDALEKFKAHDLEKSKGKSAKHGSQTSLEQNVNHNNAVNNNNNNINNNHNSSDVSNCNNNNDNTSNLPPSEPNIIITLDKDAGACRRGSEVLISSQESVSCSDIPVTTVLSPVEESCPDLTSGQTNALDKAVSASSEVLNSDYNSNSSTAMLRTESHSDTETQSHGTTRSSDNSRPHSPSQDSGLHKQPSITMDPIRNRAASTGSVKDLKKSENSGHTDHNRIMLFQVGRTDLHLISPDRKQILLHKYLKDVASCIQGIKQADHFGFICRENNVECYIGYVFKCQSVSVADDVVGAITQAFVTTSEAQRREKAPVFSCEHCPMVWYHKLCAEIEGLNDKKTMMAVFRRLELLPEEEQSTILTKFRGAETNSSREQNEFLMMLLRAHCESKQVRHVHDTAENRHEFLNQYLGGSTIFMKAKRSLTSSFDQLLKRRGSRDDFGPIVKELSLPVNATLCKDSSSPGSHSPTSRVSPGPGGDHGEGPEMGMRQRSSTVGTTTGETMKKELLARQSCMNLSPGSSQPQLPSLPSTPPNGPQLVHQKSSPMMNIFFKVGNTPKTSPPETSHDIVRQSGSWRQAIFNRVVTPNKTQDNALYHGGKTVAAKRDRNQLRTLWKKAINQQLLLIRMEKENARLKARQEEATVKRIKLEYDEISPCKKEVVEVWDLLVSKESRITSKCDPQMLLQAIKQGVPRSKRGEVWQFLAEQYCLKTPPMCTDDFPNYNVPYESLLKRLTSHPHNILVDLGRTFPGHTYFASPLGPGQLALFNLLKAYSLLDPEVGYCQGLNFVAGVLLLHMPEDSAFFLLKHLMFRRGLRRQYLPDMAALQVQLYQLSRLLHDQHPDLYLHFDAHEIAPTLYAAPWILTVFASQFPLGFVTRVFDLIFLESPEVIFRVALALLGEHKEGLLACENFEEIMDYLKGRIPNIEKVILDKIMKQVFTMDITKQLHEYEVEYHVLQEEMASPRPDIEDLNRLEEANKLLTQQNQTLTEQLEIASNNIQRLETARTSQQAAINRLESQVRSLEVSIVTMGNFISDLSETKADIEIPGDIRRLIAHLSTAEQRRNSKHNLLSSLNSKGVPLKVIDSGEGFGQKNTSNGKSILNGNSSSVLNGKNRKTPHPLKSTLSSPNLSAKLNSMSSFFGNSHQSIKHQKGEGKVESNSNAALHDLKKLPVSFIEEEEIKHPTKNDDTSSVTSSSSSNHSDSDQCLKKASSISMPLSGSKLKPSFSSFELTTRKENLENAGPDPASDHVHPLDSCMGVNFSYGGTTKLKTIRPLRAQLSRNASSDNLHPVKALSDDTPSVISNPCSVVGSSSDLRTEPQTLSAISQAKATLLSR